MKKLSVKKVLATLGLLSIVAMNSALADLSLTGSTTSLSLTGSSVNDGTFTRQTVTGALNVQVSAYVAPTLSMDISTGSISLGTLNTDGSNMSSGSVTVTGSTNAINGMTIVMNSNGLSYSGQYIGDGTFSGKTATADMIDKYKYSTGTLDTGSPSITGSDMIIFSSTNPVASTATIVKIGAVAGPTTPAGNYTDTLTFTVTGRF